MTHNMFMSDWTGKRSKGTSTVDNLTKMFNPHVPMCALTNDVFTPKILEHVQTPFHLKMMKTGRHKNGHVRGLEAVNACDSPLVIRAKTFEAVAQAKTITLFTISIGGAHPETNDHVQHTWAWAMIAGACQTRPGKYNKTKQQISQFGLAIKIIAIR